MTIRLIAPPVAQPVTVDALRRHLRVDHTDEDAVIAALRDAAVGWLDGWSGVLGRAIMPQTWRQEFAGWGDLRLLLPDVSAITVTWRDAVGAMQPAPVAALVVDAQGWLVRAEGPATDMVRVDLVAGMTPQRLPAAQALICMVVAHWFEARAAVLGGAGAEVPMGAEALIGALRWGRV
jgi:uncharacterized phiE125 gp8 family phage protein